VPWLGKELVPSLERALDQEQSVVQQVARQEVPQVPWLGKELVPSLERALDQEQSVVLLVPWSELELATQWG